MAKVISRIPGVTERGFQAIENPQLSIPAPPNVERAVAPLADAAARIGDEFIKSSQAAKAAKAQNDLAKDFLGLSDQIARSNDPEQIRAILAKVQSVATKRGEGLFGDAATAYATSSAASVLKFQSAGLARVRSVEIDFGRRTFNDTVNRRLNNIANFSGLAQIAADAGEVTVNFEAFSNQQLAKLRQEGELARAAGFITDVELGKALDKANDGSKIVLISQTLAQGNNALDRLQQARKARTQLDGMGFVDQKSKAALQKTVNDRVNTLQNAVQAEQRRTESDAAKNEKTERDQLTASFLLKIWEAKKKGQGDLDRMRITLSTDRLQQLVADRKIDQSDMTLITNALDEPLNSVSHPGLSFAFDQEIYALSELTDTNVIEARVADITERLGKAVGKPGGLKGEEAEQKLSLLKQVTDDATKNSDQVMVGKDLADAIGASATEVLWPGIPKDDIGIRERRSQTMTEYRNRVFKQKEDPFKVKDNLVKRFYGTDKLTTGFLPPRFGPFTPVKSWTAAELKEAEINLATALKNGATPAVVARQQTLLARIELLLSITGATSKNTGTTVTDKDKAGRK